MAENLAENLLNYELQLQQVEAALTSEPNNEELLKLKHDLDEVINLTKELVQGEVDAPSTKSTKPKWFVGNKCMALWDADKQYYEAVIDEINDDGTCIVTYLAYSHADTVSMSTLKTIEKRTSSMIGLPEPSSSKAKKQVIIEQKEHKKKKQQKKAQRNKQIEEEREEEKSKWQQFNAKAYSKHKKGHVKKSIFASPESVSGRVGIGTCGIGGKPMTDYQQAEKYKKKTLH